jgi:DNA-binding transcriptional ArsR family regulator
MYERLAPQAAESLALPKNLVAARDRALSVLRGWDDEYFRHVDPTILEGLAAEAARTRALIETMEPLTLVEQATNGVYFMPEPRPDLVLLIPQYHYRPWNVFSIYRTMRAIQYPVDAVPPVEGEIPPGLLRLTRALGDDSRLRILRFLAAGPQSFSSVVQFSGLAKSTVHHHLVVLRAAGLVRVYAYQGGGLTDTYSLRSHALDELDRRLRAFLTGA